MLRVELIYDIDCPNVEPARRALLEGFGKAGLQPSWTEWDRGSPATPTHARRYGSPTILVDGRDVTGVAPAGGSDSCRIYDHGLGDFKGAPPVHAIASALGDSGRCAVGHAATTRPNWWRVLASLPGVGSAFLPVGLCPACWPAYAGLLSSLGLGFVLETTDLLPVTIAFLAVALLALAFRANARRGYGPLVLGAAAVGVVLVFKFAYAVPPAVYAGLLVLVVASVLNAWPRKKRDEAGSCPQCVSELNSRSAS